MENEDEDIFFWFVNVGSFDEEEVRQLIDKRDEFTASCDCISVVYDWCDYFMMKGTGHKSVIIGSVYESFADSGFWGEFVFHALLTSKHITIFDKCEYVSFVLHMLF